VEELVLKGRLEFKVQQEKQELLALLVLKGPPGLKDLKGWSEVKV